MMDYTWGKNTIYALLCRQQGSLLSLYFVSFTASILAYKAVCKVFDHQIKDNQPKHWHTIQDKSL